MAHLVYPSPTEVQLRLDATEDRILAVVRHCPWWTSAEILGRLPGSSLAAGVILTADHSHDAMIRDILLRSFQLIFPAEGGPSALAAPKMALKAQRVLR